MIFLLYMKDGQYVFNIKDNELLRFSKGIYMANVQ